MDNGIVLVAVTIAAIAAGVIVWAVLRRNLPPEAVALIAEAAAEVRAILGAAFSEDDVRSLAGWLYDNTAIGSRYVTRDQFIELVLRAVQSANSNTANLYLAARADGVIGNSSR